MRRRLKSWTLFSLTSEFFLAVAVVMFCAGLLVGFLCSTRFDNALSVQQVALFPQQLNAFRFWSAFWSDYRWLLMSGILALSALGVFLLYPVVLLRGFLLGFSFSALFRTYEGGRFAVFLHFALTALLTCGVLLLLAMAGMQRGLAELRRGPQAAGNLYGRVITLLSLLFLGAILTAVCCGLQFWLLA